ncbi:hypothetical protein LCGC14_2298540 [marine sediment metagenome]|uniref:DUF2283 domain-containing protein n=1 Tax=marine sediment metagenome TaxID=412755 RepID=A0A0F9FJ39_9ZZZZ
MTPYIHYSKRADSLIIYFEKPVPAISHDCDGVFWLRIDTEGKIVGIEIEGFKKHFIPKYTVGKKPSP